MESEMATSNTFGLLSSEMDIGHSTNTSMDTSGNTNKRRRGLSPPLANDNNRFPEVPLIAHFSRDTHLRSRGEKYRWVMKVLRMAPFKDIKHAIELRDGRNSTYIKCKTKAVLDLLTSSGADNEVLVLPKTYGKGECKNLIVFGVPTCAGPDDMREENPNVIHAKRVTRNGEPTERVIITYQCSSVTAPSSIRILAGLGPLRCAIFHSMTPFCTHCSKWGHGIRACPREESRCKYCAGYHPSKMCAEKIATAQTVPRKCVNCRGDHNADSPLCRHFPNDRKKKLPQTPTPVGTITKAAPCITDVSAFPALPTPTRNNFAKRDKVTLPKKESEPSAPVHTSDHQAPLPSLVSTPVVCPSNNNTQVNTPSTQTTPPATNAQTSEGPSTATLLHTILEMLQRQYLAQQEQDKYMRESLVIQKQLIAHLISTNTNNQQAPAVNVPGHSQP